MREAIDLLTRFDSFFLTGTRLAMSTSGRKQMGGLAFTSQVRALVHTHDEIAVHEVRYRLFGCRTFAYAQSTVPHVSAGAVAVRSKTPGTSELLRALDNSLETVVSRVSPAVVQIVVAGMVPRRITVTPQRESSGSMLSPGSLSILMATS